MSGTVADSESGAVDAVIVTAYPAKRAKSTVKIYKFESLPYIKSKIFNLLLGDIYMNFSSTLTRADLADTMNRQVGLSRADSAVMVESILDFMIEALVSGENVKISGFGTFVLRDKGERTGRNPKTGVEVPIAPRRVLTFRASQTMRDRIIAAG
ncbi:integration host factor, alpha subunit [Parasphingorhabdus marina DSM 22363]|uniref:Integration host factor subunit alpha n=2 Tax=Parasphingorhabdus marina TaxID=394732 RepID=A0A1N6CT86_9SPHN|nr:integration host factor, alpha subunit [Parasphingorhabdus marina DSM 22363]